MVRGGYPHDQYFYQVGDSLQEFKICVICNFFLILDRLTHGCGVDPIVHRINVAILPSFVICGHSELYI